MVSALQNITFLISAPAPFNFVNESVLTGYSSGPITHNIVPWLFRFA